MKQNRTALRVIDILNLLSQYTKGLTLKELYTHLDIPKTSTFDIVNTLVATAVVAEHTEGNEKRYQVGIQAFRIGASYTPNKNLIQVASPYLETLAEKTNKTAILAMFDQGKAIFIHKHDPPTPTVLSTCAVGTVKEFHCTSLGKAILSVLPEDQCNALIEETVFDKKTDFTITTKEALIKEIAKTKERGFAVDDRECEDHVFCMGVPLFNYTGDVVGAISISGLYREDANIDNQVAALQATAKEISHKLGFSG